MSLTKLKQLGACCCLKACCAKWRDEHLTKFCCCISPLRVATAAAALGMVSLGVWTLVFYGSLLTYKTNEAPPGILVFL
eukprot:SAG11_NODE_20208_length_450_cov_1.222222_1_plen_78_part_10